MNLITALRDIMSVDYFPEKVVLLFSNITVFITYFSASNEAVLIFCCATTETYSIAYAFYHGKLDSFENRIFLSS